MIYILLVISLYLVYYDIKYLKVPNKIIILLLIIALLNAYLNGVLIGSLIAGLLCLLFYITVYMLSKGNIGIGDIKYSIITAITLGTKLWYRAMIITVLISLIILLISKPLKKVPVKSKVPFIPPLFLGSLISYILQ